MKTAHCKLASLPSQESISTFKQLGKWWVLLFWLLTVWVTLEFQPVFYWGFWFKASDSYYEMHGCLKWIKYMKNYLSPGKSRANQLVYIKIQYGQMFVDHLQDWWSCLISFYYVVNFYRLFRFVLFKLRWWYLQWFNILVVYRSAKIQVLNRAHCPGVSILTDSCEGKYFDIKTGMSILLSIPLLTNNISRICHTWGELLKTFLRAPSPRVMTLFFPGVRTALVRNLNSTFTSGVGGSHIYNIIFLSSRLWAPPN